MSRHIRAAVPHDVFTLTAIACISVLAAVVLSGAQKTGVSTDRPAFPNLSSVPTDLTVPPMTLGEPAPGCRVKQVNPDYQGKDVYHALYLPVDWKKGKLYPVIVEYAGNGPGRNEYGDFCSGQVEGSKLGYGISGGKGFIWVCMPFVNSKTGQNQTWWWGDPEATVQYCKTTVRRICEEYGGDPSRVILAGFSRGAIACNYIGLRDDSIADMWLAFIAYSHYDGVRKWDYADSDRRSALDRLKRLKGRAVFSCQERTVDDIRQYVGSTGIIAPFTFLTIPFRNHNDAWVLRDLPARATLRSWLAEVLKTRPGTHTVEGRVKGSDGRALSGVCIESGPSHFTYTDRKGRFILSGLIDSQHNLAVTEKGRTFTPLPATVDIQGEDVRGLTVTAAR